MKIDQVILKNLGPWYQPNTVNLNLLYGTCVLSRSSSHMFNTGRSFLRRVNSEFISEDLKALN